MSAEPACWPEHLLTAPPPGVRLLARIESRCGFDVSVDASRWHAPADAADLTAVARTNGTVLDIGCGPGRITAAVRDAHRDALGVDISAAAIQQTRGRGCAAVRADVFGPVPAAGLWDSALLLDGNIGIGGDPVRLLERVAAVLHPTGILLVEACAPHTASRNRDVRVRHSGGRSGWFAWATVSVGDLPAIARTAGWTVSYEWSIRDRWFVELRK